MITASRQCSGCAIAASLAIAAAANAQYVIPPDIYQDQQGFDVGPSYVGPIIPGAYVDPYGTADYRGAASEGDYDAYDGAGVILMSTPTTTRGNPTSPIIVSRRADALQSLNVYRWIDTYTNITEEATTFTAYFWTNLGSDGGDVVALQDPFRFVSFENDPDDGETPTDPVVAMMHGNNQWTVGHVFLERFGFQRGDGNFFADDVLRTFRLTLEPGQSVSLMFADFLAFTPDEFGFQGSPQDVADALARTQQLLEDPSPLFADLGRGQAESIINWTIPSPASAPFLAIGLVLVRRRR
ncbi:MAG: hypothetical protein JNK58_03515 [Phycisphaerae bacterium]|nr:hypothetical protein [Phycisphaerae bacterium]